MAEIAEIAEIETERSQRRILPWILALLLLALVIWGVARAMDRRPAAPAVHPGAAAADTLRDDTPPRLRQFA